MEQKIVDKFPVMSGDLTVCKKRFEDLQTQRINLVDANLGASVLGKTGQRAIAGGRIKNQIARSDIRRTGRNIGQWQWRGKLR